MATVVNSQEDEILSGDDLKHLELDPNTSCRLTKQIKQIKHSTEAIESCYLSNDFSFNIADTQYKKTKKKKRILRKNKTLLDYHPLNRPRRNSKRKNKIIGSKTLSNLTKSKSSGFDFLSGLAQAINGQKWISELPQKLQKNDGTLFEIINGKIKAIYKDDLNILQIHSYVCEKLSLESQNISQLEEELKKIQLEIKKPNTAVVMNSLLTKLVETMGKIQELKTGSKYHMYLMSVNPLIKSYQKIGSKFRKVSFSTLEDSNDDSKNIHDIQATTLVDELVAGSRDTPRIPTGSRLLRQHRYNAQQVTSDDVKTSDQQRELNHKYMIDAVRHTIVEQYLDITKNFVDIDSYRIINQEEKCFECGTNLSEFKFDTNGVSYCPKCGEEVVQIVHLPFYYDQSRVSSDKNTYKDRDNFIIILKKFKGEIPIVIPEDMELQLDIYFVKNGCSTGADIRKMPLNSDNESRGKLTRADLHEALKKTKNVKFYDDVSVIASNYWGWNLPVIKDSIVTQIIEDYDESQKIFKQFKGERKSSMNTHYRLFRHLWRRGIKRNPDDFKMIKTEKTLKYHEKAWKIFCDQLDWEWIPFEQIKYYFNRK